MFGAAAPVFWPFAGTDFLLNVSITTCIVALLVLPLLFWGAVRRRFGLRASGPLWPLLFFELLATFYAFMTPPWLMPDEPQHMYYVELVRYGGAGLPEQLAAGLVPRRQEDVVEAIASYRRILRSARDSQVGRWLPYAENELAQGRLPGPSELLHPPLYYSVAAGLTTPFDHADVRGRLAVLRSFGVMLTGFTIWLCGAAARMVWPTRRRLAEGPLVLAAGVPTVAAFAGAVNSDPIANLLGALVLVILVAATTGIFRRHPALWATLLVGSALLGFMTKRSVLPLLLAAPLVLLFRALRSQRAIGAVIAAQLVAAVVLLTIPAQRLAAWEQPERGDHRCPGGATGQWTICLDSRASTVTQFTSTATFEKLAGRPITLGFWTRGSPSGRLVLLVGGGASAVAKQIPVGRAWSFHTLQFERPADFKELPIVFGTADDRRVDIDGVVLARGRFSGTAPEYSDDAELLRWDGRVAKNYMVNGSAEDAVRGAPEWIPDSAARMFDGAVQQVDRTLTLWPDTVASMDVVGRRIVETFGMFWATIGWGVPPLLLPVGLLWVLALFVAGGWLGTAAELASPSRLGSSAARRGVGALAVCLFVACAAVVGRGIPPDRELVISGRYLFPALAAAAVVIVAGWRRFWPGDDRGFRNAVRWFALGAHAVFIVVLAFPFLAQ